MRKIRVVASALAVVAGTVGCGGEVGKQAGGTVTVTVGGATVTETVTVAAPAATVPSEAETSEASVDEEQPPEQVEASVVAEKTGVGQDEETVSYGIVLVNPSPDEDALDVTVTANILTADGTILASESATINVIPADATYYLGGETYLEAGDKAVRVEPIIDVGERAAAAYPLPEVSKVRASEDEYSGVRVRGEVENSLDGPLSQFARINVVLFNADGAVVGGGFTYLDADLPPGRRAAFDTYVTVVEPGQVAEARASMENEVAE